MGRSRYPSAIVDVVPTHSTSVSGAECRIVIDERTLEFLQEARDNTLLGKPSGCDGQKYNICHLTLAPLLDALARIFPAVDVWDDPDGLIEAIDAMADAGLQAGSGIDAKFIINAMISARTQCPAEWAQFCLTSAQDLISGDAGNTIRTGTDGKLFENDAVI